MKTVRIFECARQYGKQTRFIHDQFVKRVFDRHIALEIEAQRDDWHGQIVKRTPRLFIGLDMAAGDDLSTHHSDAQQEK